MDDSSEGQELELKLLEEKRQELDPLNLVGGFSSAFDTISSAYGWRDEEIHDLTLARMQQVVSAIRLRQAGEDRRTRLHTSWAVRTIATFIAVGYQAETNPAIAEAAKLTIDDIEKKIMQEVSETVQVPDEPAIGSTERLKTVFGMF